MILYYFLTSASIILVSGYEYVLNYDRLQLAYYDKDLVEDAYFFFGKYNRTNFCLNTSFVLLKDLNGHNLKFTTTFHQFLNNEFKPLGMKMSFNVCEYWEKNIHGFSSYLSKFGNLEGCDVKKGHYYLYNFVPDENTFPKYVPLGEFMMQMNVVWNTNVPLLKLQWCITSQFKRPKVGKRVGK